MIGVSEERLRFCEEPSQVVSEEEQENFVKVEKREVCLRILGSSSMNELKLMGKKRG